MSSIINFSKISSKVDFGRLPQVLQDHVSEYIGAEIRIEILMEQYRVRNVIEFIRPIIEENEDKNLLSLLLFHFGQYGVIFRSTYWNMEPSSVPIRANKILYSDLDIILTEMELHENNYDPSYFKDLVFPFLCLTNYIFTKKYNKSISEVAWTEPLCEVPFCDRSPWDDYDPWMQEENREEIETDAEDDKKYYNILRRQKEEQYYSEIRTRYEEPDELDEDEESEQDEDNFNGKCEDDMNYYFGSMKEY
jgi:hypothetical protein